MTHATSPHGLLNVDKPAGLTSRDVVNRVQSLLPRKTRIGHAGTLDPLATGVLIVCVGAATRLVEYIQRMDKEYLAEFTLGAASDTDDALGQITPTPPVPPIPDQRAIESALRTFVGEILQTPPQFSAAKRDGRRAYKLARRGEEFSLSAKPVQIHAIELLGFQFPELRLRIHCGKGTYIRSIARDLGAVLGCGGYVRSLRRTRIGPFLAQNALQLDHLAADTLPFLPLEQALSDLPRISLQADLALRFCQGQKLSGLTGPAGAGFTTVEVVVTDAGNRLLGIGHWSEGTLSPAKVFGKEE
jgi:tRNA pseudouridine55 synthase